MILAREAGRALSLEDVDVESLVPAALRDVGREEFLARLRGTRRADAGAPRAAATRKAAACATSPASTATAARTSAWSRCRAEHACRHTRLTDNLVQFRTRRYAENPLVVQGPGAGPEVTAAGVFGDMLAIAQSLGAQTACASSPPREAARHRAADAQPCARSRPASVGNIGVGFDLLGHSHRRRRATSRIVRRIDEPVVRIAAIRGEAAGAAIAAAGSRRATPPGRR